MGQLATTHLQTLAILGTPTPWRTHTPAALCSLPALQQTEAHGLRITAMCTGPAGPVGGGVCVNVRFAK